MTNLETQQLDPFALPEEKPAPAFNTTSDDRLWGALIYWSQLILPAVAPAIALLSDQTNKIKFLRYHAIHSLALLVATLLYEILAAMVVVLIGAVLPCSICLTWLIFVLPVVPFAYYGIKAYQGETPDVPWLTKFLANNRIV
ncbi:MAG: DUF4870 domain-containing protein [Chloroflexi bacterium]|nr:DUF4870 domain-containing protein [Chloroflexota bacterium]